MSSGIYVALSGAIAQQTALETTAENLANAGTAGYQRMRPIFREALSQATDATQPSRYTAIAGTVLDQEPGNLRETGNGLDVALPKGSYLAVQTTRGERYTRAGSLRVGADGLLQTADGHPVLDASGAPIRLGKGQNPSITRDGKITAGDDDHVVSRLRVVTFTRPEMLLREGNTLLSAPPVAGPPQQSTDPLEVGALEENNGNIVQSMTELTAANRSFDAFTKAIEAFRDADRKLLSSVPNFNG